MNDQYLTEEEERATNPRLDRLLRIEEEERAIHQKLTTIEVNDQDLSDYFKDMGKKGGKAGTGRAKTRSLEHYRRIAKERWRTEREKRANKP